MPARPAAPRPPTPVIDVTPALNIQSLVVIALRLTALNFLLRLIVEVTTPVLIYAGIYQRPEDQMPSDIGWVLVGCLFIGAVLLWLLAWPIARIIARGVPNGLSLDNLSLSDCYSIVFTGLGVVYIVSHLPGVWNWSIYILHSIFRSVYVTSTDPNRGYQVASTFIPFLAGILLVWKRNKFARALAGTSTRTAVISLNQPWTTAQRPPAEPVTISIDPPRQ